MTKTYYTLISTLVLLMTVSLVKSQCDFKSKIANDGNLYYYMEAENFYWTKSKSLSGGIVTDKEYYYVILRPLPFPEKQIAKKLKENLLIKLANNKEYQLEFYYSDFDNNYSIFEMMFLIDKKDLKDFRENEVLQASINMGGEEGVRTYTFKLHKATLQHQLNCFIEDKKKGKKKCFFRKKNNESAGS